MTSPQANPTVDTVPRAFHPVVLAAVYVLQAAVSNGVGPASFIRPLVVAAAAALAVTIMLWAILRNQPLAGLFASGILLVLISHDPVLHLLTQIRDTRGMEAASAAIALLLSGGVAGLAIGVDQARRGHLRAQRLRAPTRALNIFSALLLAVVVAPAVPAVPAWVGEVASATTRAGGGSAAARELPDVYLFLLDGYSRADELERQFGIDNTGFVTELERRGFGVDVQSRSNYTYTALTLSSMLSSEYVPTDESGVISEPDLIAHLHRAMEDSPALTQLREAGYQLIATAPGWEQISLRPAVDRFVERPELSDFELSLLARSWLPDLPPIPRNLFFMNLRSRIEGVLDDAVSVARMDQPTFAFVHVPSPHLPLAFGPDGAPSPYTSRQYLAGRASEFGLSERDYQLAYGENLAQLNARVLETIDAITAASSRPPVIVLMSDHGYNGDTPVHGEPMLHNLFAIRSPGDSALADSTTPVNLLRGLVRTYVGTDVPASLPDRFFTVTIRGKSGHYELTLSEVLDP